MPEYLSAVSPNRALLRIYGAHSCVLCANPSSQLPKIRYEKDLAVGLRVSEILLATGGRQCIREIDSADRHARFFSLWYMRHLLGFMDCGIGRAFLRDAYLILNLRTSVVFTTTRRDFKSK